jgi:hypothetical protein
LGGGVFMKFAVFMLAQTPIASGISARFNYAMPLNKYPSSAAFFY